ncbi:uncharacterized protein PAC_16395 [Phialocephala subalpina]|uniref:Zn(2)-C6 fungal-type domain-containing protein n=1 Tax=Phialocephala subalpina TaxID=576137 RepID=A0A1L7XNA9_9HELO|nr:uncharacterized protein PAC_16395 [Phialocephala subalpina]
MTEGSPSHTPLPQGGEEEASPLSVQACRRCRKKKLGCSRDLPICKRCDRISAVCEYPPPPDRKALAALRSQNAGTRARRESESSGGLQGQQQFPIDAGTWSLQQVASSIGFGHHAISPMARPEAHALCQRRLSGSEDYRVATPLVQGILQRTTLPSSEVAVFLFEIYFSRLYNASLLFHKKTFLSEYAAGSIPDFVALSIFALASIFLRQSSGQPRQDNDEDEIGLGISMLSVVDSTKQGLEWASSASQRVLMQADVPRLETVQACQNLVLYWFSTGQTDRAHIHAHIAYKTARLLNLHVQNNSEIESSDLSDELGRRCFWSCWISNCISQDNAYFKSDPWKEAVGLMLPSDEDSWASRKPISTEFFNNSGNIESKGTLSFDRQPSAMGELVKLYCLWWEIQHFIKQHNDTKLSDSSAKFAALLELDQRLRLVFEHHHPNLRYLNASSFKSGKIDAYKLFSLHSLYHLCACALHSSIVPVFSDITTTPLLPKTFVRLSAQESVNHAVLTLDMATAFIDIRPDTSRLPSIMGYAMFVASTVHFKSLVAQRKFRAHGLGRFKAAISILERLKEYWTPLQAMWSDLKSVFASQGININTISTSDTRSQRSSDEEPTDVERIASHECMPQNAGATDIYTYVADEETKGASPRRHSDSPAHTTRASSQNTPPSTNITVGSTPGQNTQEINVRPEGGQTTLDTRTYTLPHQQLHDPHSFSSHPGHGFEQSFIGNPQSVQHDFGRMDAGMPRGFSTLEPVAEEDQMQGQSAGPSHIPVTQTMAGFGNVSGDMDVAMVDGAYTWWDQSFETFDMDSNQANQRPEDRVYTFGMYSF